LFAKIKIFGRFSRFLTSGAPTGGGGAPGLRLQAVAAVGASDLQSAPPVFVSQMAARSPAISVGWEHTTALVLPPRSRPNARLELGGIRPARNPSGRSSLLWSALPGWRGDEGPPEPPFDWSS